MKRTQRAHNNPPEPLEPTGLMIGYARVSTPDQDPQMQIDALVRAGCDPTHIYSETASGVKQKRPMLERALKDCRRGDTFVVYKLDRFGRNLLDLITKLQDLDRRGIRFKSLTEGIDTSTAVGRLLMHIIGAMAEFERDLIAERTQHGVRAKIERGEYHGGKPTFDHEKARELFRQGKDGIEVANAVGVTRSRIYQLFDADERERLLREGQRRKTKRSR